MKKRIIKAWAIVSTKNFAIENADYSNDEGCDCCQGNTDALAIFAKKKIAVEKNKYVYNSNLYKVVEIKLKLT